MIMICLYYMALHTSMEQQMVHHNFRPTDQPTNRPTDLEIVGFFGTSGFYVNFNRILSPAFLYGNKQFSPKQIDHNIRSCQLRYTCEVVYYNVTNCDRLNGFIPRNIFHHFQDLCDWGHGRANLYLPLQMPAKYNDYFSEVPRHVNNES
mmetsp:Transcript_30386/g.30878  ORF Transcript_30386/g.30878 Transcript_30386/m.30878 type:complete len:149 (+) Transcript_30386:122-568(+)